MAQEKPTKIVSMRAVDLGYVGLELKTYRAGPAQFEIVGQALDINVAPKSYDLFGYPKPEICMTIDADQYQRSFLGTRHTIPEWLLVRDVWASIGEFGVLRILTAFELAPDAPVATMDDLISLSHIVGQTSPNDVLLYRAVARWLEANVSYQSGPLWPLNLVPSPQDDANLNEWTQHQSLMCEEMAWRSTHILDDTNRWAGLVSGKQAKTCGFNHYADDQLARVSVSKLQPLNAIYLWDTPNRTMDQIYDALMVFSLPQVQRTMLEFDRQNAASLALRTSNFGTPALASGEVLKYISETGVYLARVPRYRSFFPNDVKEWFDANMVYYRVDEETSGLQRDIANLRTAQSARNERRSSRFNRSVTFIGLLFTSLSFISTVTAVSQFYYGDSSALDPFEKTMLLGLSLSFGLIALLWLFLSTRRR